MEIAILVKQDIKDFAVLMLELYSKWDKIDPIDKINKDWFCSKKHYSYIHKLIKDRNCLILIAKESNNIVSYLIAFIKERQPFLQKVGDIAEAYTIPEYRKKGIVNTLTESAFDWFKKNKIKWFTVSTHSLDKEAISFWKKRGFVEFNKNFKLRWPK
jgi:ribosomal protein S18 acetylase RimI-like enzyme